MDQSTALHISLAKGRSESDLFPSVSSRIAFLRRVLRDGVDVNTTVNPYHLAAKGVIPIIVSTNSKDEIASIVRLKEELGGIPRFVILGGAEAHLVARSLARSQIPVIVTPARCKPSSWNSLACLTGSPLSNGTGFHILHEAGVEIGIGLFDPGSARDLAWDAGWVSATGAAHTIDEKQAIGFVTWNLEKIFGLDNHLQKKRSGLKVGLEAEFVVYSGSPLDMKSRVVAVVGGGRELPRIFPKAV